MILLKNLYVHKCVDRTTTSPFKVQCTKIFKVYNQGLCTIRYSPVIYAGKFECCHNQCHKLTFKNIPPLKGLFRIGSLYSEGCDSVDVPYDQTICYCKQSLCNGSNNSLATLSTIILTLFSIYFL